MIKNFKISFFAVLFAAFLFLGACVSEDKPSTGAIVGTWNFDSYSLVNATINNQPAITYLTTVMGLTPTQAQLAQTIFLSSVVDQEELEKTTFTFNADGSYVIRVDGVEEDSGTYSLQNNNTKLFLTSTNGNQEFDISGLTNNRMNLVLEDSGLYDVNTDGTDEDIEFAVEITLVK
jgi:hypothetical protein